MKNNERLSSEVYQSTYSNTNHPLYDTIKNIRKLFYHLYQYEWLYQSNWSSSVWAYHEDAAAQVKNIDEQAEYQAYEDTYYEDVYWQK